MATVEECRAALERLAEELAAADGVREAALPDRSLSCRITDLDVTFGGRLVGGRITGITAEPAGRARVRLETTGDDLVRLVDGELGFGAAWASGRVRVHASVRDLWRLRTLL